MPHSGPQQRFGCHVSFHERVRRDRGTKFEEGMAQEAPAQTPETAPILPGSNAYAVAKAFSWEEVWETESEDSSRP